MFHQIRGVSGHVMCPGGEEYRGVSAVNHYEMLNQLETWEVLLSIWAHREKIPLLPCCAENQRESKKGPSDWQSLRRACYNR